MSEIGSAEFKALFLSHTPLIDVRAPVEFNAGSLPGAVNIPLLDDEQRALVGTTYKKSGSEEAVKLGHELVSGEVKEARLQQWMEYISQHPDTILFCFRGGLRSKITQQWLKDRGISRPLISGGYKKARQFLREETERFCKQHSLLVISGPTGSAKTDILSGAADFHPAVNLEAIAKHRGSAFGAMAEAQPSQIDFENLIAVRLLNLADEKRGILVEDESRMIGRCAVPESFFERMREADVLFVEESFDQRVENIFREYVAKTALGGTDLLAARAQFAKYRTAVMMISRKLGGLRANEILQDLTHSESEFLHGSQYLPSNKAWIAILLTYYYDPLYAQNFAKRKPHIVAQDRAQAILDYLRSSHSGLKS